MCRGLKAGTGEYEETLLACNTAVASPVKVSNLSGPPVPSTLAQHEHVEPQILAATPRVSDGKSIFIPA
jgi:hypothetical protein